MADGPRTKQYRLSPYTFSGDDEARGCPCSLCTRPVITACCANALPDDSASAAAIANDRRLLRGRRTGLIGPLTRGKCPTADQTPLAALVGAVPAAGLQTAHRRAEELGLWDQRQREGRDSAGRSMTRRDTLGSRAIGHRETNGSSPVSVGTVP